MKLRIAIIILFGIIALVYTAGFIGNPLLFIICFQVSFLLAIYLIVAAATWRFMPDDIKRIYEKNRIRYHASILVSLSVFFLGGLAINNYLLPGILHPASIVGNAGILLFAVFLGWNLIRPNKGRLVLSGTILFVFFIMILSIVSRMSIENTTRDQPSSDTALKSLPYLQWVPAKESVTKSGVVQHDESRSFSGINIYSPREAPVAYLLDMSGNRLHTWSKKIQEDDAWQHIEMDKDGSVFVIVKDTMLLKLDWDSNIEWINRMRCHHDIAIGENGDLYVLARKDKIAFLFGLPVPVLCDYLIILAPGGDVKQEFSLFEVYKNHVPFSAVVRIYRWFMNPDNVWESLKVKAKHGYLFIEYGTPPDVFHDNTVEILNRAIEGFCKKGDILLSPLRFDLIGVVDTTQRKLVWEWGPGELSRQHHPTLLDNGNILIFDNGYAKKRSRIVELDPIARNIVWEYKAHPPERFYSPTRGSSQRLPNGNTLITESDSGHVIEVTRNGDIVWEFFEPEVNVESKERSAIYRMMRITNPENYEHLRDLSKPNS